MESDTQVVTATEIKTSSVLITPEPTWETQTVTVTPTSTLIPQILFNTRVVPEPILIPQPFKSLNSSPRKRNNFHQQAQVVEIDDNTTPSGTRNKQDRFKHAYGAFFADSGNLAARIAKSNLLRI